MHEKTPFDFEEIYAALRKILCTPYDNVGHSIGVAVRMMFSLRWRNNR